VDVIASYLSLKVADKQTLLETTDLSRRIEMVIGFVQKEIEIIETEKRIRSRVKRQVERPRRNIT